MNIKILICLQHVLEMGKSHARTRIIKSFTGAVVQMSQHKYASNVVEKCLEYGDTAERELLIEEIIGHSEDNENLLVSLPLAPGAPLQDISWFA